jgi:hypothetical protein
MNALLRGAGLAIAGAAPFVLALMAYHSHAFGGPFESGYKHLNDPGYQGWHLGGFLGIRFPDPSAFAGSFFSPLRGLFVLSPFLLIAPFGLRLLRRTDRALLVIPPSATGQTIDAERSVYIRAA